MSNANTTQASNLPKSPAPTASERFVNEVSRLVRSELSDPVLFTDAQKALAQHLFIKVDASLQEAEARRLAKDIGGKFTPYNWGNINMTKLALDATDRIRLGLDALISGHIYPIFYYNNTKKKYDVDLRVGYKGELFYKSRAALEVPKDIRLELVYSNDTFEVFKKGLSHEVEGYELHVNDPFDRGEVVGGFGYIVYDDQSKNQLVIVSKAKMDQARKVGAGSGNFWTDWEEEMYYKTLVHRVCGKLNIDPSKVNVAAMTKVENEDYSTPHIPADIADQRQNETPLVLHDDEATVIDTSQVNRQVESEAPVQQGDFEEPLREPGF